MTHAFIGMMVLYRLTEGDAKATNMRREDARQNIEKMRDERPGFQAHIGNKVSEGDRVPMIITQVSPNSIEPRVHGFNWQVFLDGNDSLWVMAVQEGDQPGEWQTITD